ncbi:hypothetical protein [Polycladidibacter hongkongensis]|uniref:hypothetical protein n=1 Tax=Polycladidibacter hongkongensis TaxID=1647556 RepID=UPI00082B82F2|nr:hypothetical protein [Pseudovibrio hongkongensis]
MASIIIYGGAVQQARNVLRSAQISTMLETLRVVLWNQAGTAGTNIGSAFSGLLVKWSADLLADAQGPAVAIKRLQDAHARLIQFDNGTDIFDVFAVGDGLRGIGEYFELGGGGARGKQVEDLRRGLRNKIAFNVANRARKPVPDFALQEWPDLGIFKFNLLDRSTVKYMERFYGPYIGADISGTTTDSLAVLAAFNADTLGDDDLTKSLDQAMFDGEELVPIATMVLQYHHSLMETGLALSLSSSAMGGSSVLPEFNFYNFRSLGQKHMQEAPAAALMHGNKVLSRDLAGRGLVVLRDLIDINLNPYADVEIGLLVENPTDSSVFTLNSKYDKFYRERKRQSQQNYFYQHGDPSLAAVANDMAGLNIGDAVTFDNLIAMNSIELAELKLEGRAFDDLQAALQAAGGGLRVANAPSNAANSQAANGGQQSAPLQASQVVHGNQSSASANQAAQQETAQQLAKQVDKATLQKALSLLAMQH